MDHGNWFAPFFRDATKSKIEKKLDNFRFLHKEAVDQMDQNLEEQANIPAVTSVSADYKTKGCVFNDSDIFRFFRLEGE